MMDIAAMIVVLTLAAPWPQEAREQSLVNCGVAMAQRAADADHASVARACVCIQNAMEDLMTAGQMYDLESMPDSEADAHPMTKKAEPVVEACLARHLSG
jgi:hypothetical protein